MKDKRKLKHEQHYDILCNGKKAKILNYIIKETEDGGRTLELVTKIPNEILSAPQVLLQIPDGEGEVQFPCLWTGQFHRSSLRRYLYRIQEEQDGCAEQME